MKLIPQDLKTRPRKTSLLIVFAFEGRTPVLPKGVRLPKLATEGFKAEFRSQRWTDAAEGPWAQVLILGLGKIGEFDADRLRRLGALAGKAAEARSLSSATIWAPDAVTERLPGSGGGAELAGRLLAEGALMGTYRFQRYKSKPKAESLKTLVLAGEGSAFKAGVEHGRVLGEANRFTRDLQNAPGNELTPRDMAGEARKLARRSPRITAKVLDEAAMKKLKMGALLSVSRGSVEPARLIHLVYKPKGRSRGKIALVGKGLTFDAGGISLKPSSKMWDMKYDMSGGAAVLGAFHALAGVDVPFEVHGVVPSSENLPDAAATKPGDLVTAMDGTTIEVLNTDAEGRLILCDALCYAIRKIEPDTIIDLATLTGAVVVALGHEFSGLFATTDELRDTLIEAGRAAGEAVWPLPLEDFHKEQLKGEVGDLRNINGGEHGNGSTAGAAFLWHFVGKTEWAHLDIAGAAWGARQRDWVGGSQGSGVGARLLIEYLQRRAERGTPHKKRGTKRGTKKRGAKR